MKTGFVAASLALLVGVSQAATMLTESGTAVDTVTSLDQIEQILRDTQKQFWQVVPPADDPFYLDPEHMVRVVDWDSKDWPKPFLKQMYAEMGTVGSSGSLFPLYPLVVVEERDGDVVYFNTYNQEVWRTSAPKDYNEYLFAFLKYGVATADELTDQEKIFGRSSNVGMRILLLPEAFASLYESEAATDAAAMQLAAEPTAESSMLMAAESDPPPPPGGGGSSTNSGGGVTSNPIATLTFEVPTNFGRYAEIFQSESLASPSWSVFINKTNVVAGADLSFSVLASSNQPVRFFRLGDADILGASGADSDHDGYSDAREYYVTGTSPTNFDPIDVDGDYMLDGFETMLFGDLSQTATNDFDGDGLSNTNEMELTASNVVFHSDPTLYDTDAGGLNDGYERTNGWMVLDPYNPADDTADYDHDGLNNLEEFTLGTSMGQVDTDGDGVNDGMEVAWGTNANPLVSNDWASVWTNDFDLDGLSLEQEIEYGTNPYDGSDGNQTNNVVDVTLTVGEKQWTYWDGVNWLYELEVSGERSISLASTVDDSDHGRSATFKLKKGCSYDITLRRMETYVYECYDYVFPFVSQITGSGIVIDGVNDDPDSIIGAHMAYSDAQRMWWLFANGYYPNWTTPVALTAQMHIADADLDIEGLADSVEADAPGRTIAVGGEPVDLAASLAPNDLPDDTSVKLVASDPSKLRILDGATELIGPTAGSNWVSSLANCDLAESDMDLTVVGVATGTVSLAEVYKDSDGVEVCRDTVVVTVMPCEIVKIPLGGSATLSDTIVGKTYVPTKWGGDLTLSNGNVQLFYTDGSDLGYGTAAEILNGDFDANIVAQGSPCTYEVPENKHGWYYVKLTTSSSASIKATFVQGGEADTRPWNGWYWPFPDSQNPNLYDDDGDYTPLMKYDDVYGTTARANEEAYQPSQNADTGHCWGWALASVSISQPPETTATNGVFFNQDEMEGLFTDLADGSQGFEWVVAGPGTQRMPAGPVTENPNEPIDTFAAQVHNQLRYWLKEQRLSLVANLRAESTSDSSTQIWNHAVFKYESNMEEATGGKETVVKITTKITSNKDLPNMPVDGDCRTNTYVYILEYANGTINTNSTYMNWLSCYGYAPANFAAVPLGIDWRDGVHSGITYTNVYDGLYQ